MKTKPGDEDKYLNASSKKSEAETKMEEEAEESQVTLPETKVPDIAEEQKDSLEEAPIPEASANPLEQVETTPDDEDECLNESSKESEAETKIQEDVEESQGPLPEPADTKVSDMYEEQKDPPQIVAAASQAISYPDTYSIPREAQSPKLLVETDSKEMEPYNDTLTYSDTEDLSRETKKSKL